jgi:3-methyl-2-oxobutanoate hydroxymethyltransferase
MFDKRSPSQHPWVMVTAYDAIMARDAEAAEVDFILVGDSLGRAILGYEGVNEVTLEDMIHHSKAVVRGCKKPQIISDLPDGSYEKPEQALASAKRLMATGVHAVKLEGPEYESIQLISENNIPLVAHLGYTPQTADREPGNKKVRAQTLQSAEDLLIQALGVQKAGAKMLVIEMVPREVAKGIAEKLDIPVIGIGSGPDVDGQVLVCTDLWGDHHFPFKFLKSFGDLQSERMKAISAYTQSVQEGSYPEDRHSFHIKKSDLNLWLDFLNQKSSD